MYIFRIWCISTGNTGLHFGALPSNLDGAPDLGSAQLGADAPFLFREPELFLAAATSPISVFGDGTIATFWRWVVSVFDSKGVPFYHSAEVRGNCFSSGSSFNVIVEEGA